MMNCATMGCDGCPTEYFERGGVGSHYCAACSARIEQEGYGAGANELRAALMIITHKANEAAIHRDDDDVLTTIIEIARAALTAAPQPAEDQFYNAVTEAAKVILSQRKRPDSPVAHAFRAASSYLDDLECGAETTNEIIETFLKVLAGEDN